MPQRSEALIEKELLVWARESIGLDVTEAARRIHVKPESLAQWELGTIRPSIPQARKAASVYKRSLAVFYLPGPPREDFQMQDFRTIPEERRIHKSPSLHLAIRQVHYKRDTAIQLAEELEDDIPPFDRQLSLRDNSEEMASRIRESLGVDANRQCQWKDIWQALNSWKEIIEQQNVLVFQVSGVTVTEMRGFSVWRKTLPAIALNSKDSPSGRIFTLLHEYIHLLLNTGGLCDDFGTFRAGPSKEEQTEVFCNYLAGRILVPADSLLNEDVVRRKTKTSTWQDSDIALLARKYSVSWEVILRRLLITGRVTESFYQSKRRQYLQAYETEIKKKSKRRASQSSLAIAHNGLTFLRMALRAYHESKLTGNKLSEYLGVSLKHVPEIQRKVYGRNLEART
jgi:Zn-dependent peptidase ImmA (M78 family)/DNA-binding XRE family transcriptional regulator